MIALAEIDQLFEETLGIRVVDELQTDESGVDPVGSAPAQPRPDGRRGARHQQRHPARPPYYPFMAWAAWKATRVRRGRGRGGSGPLMPISSSATKPCRRWSHLIAGGRSGVRSR